MSARRRNPRRQRAWLVEALEPRQLLASTTFAIIGDYSSDVQTAPTRDVSNLVKSWNPSFVVTTGDNNYPVGGADTIDANIGQWYHQFIYPYSGSYGAGAADQQNHFWPTLGRHDWMTPNAQPYLDYFTLPGNERYYTVVQGSVQLFIIDGWQDSDGTSSTSVQANWLKNQLAASTATWKLVFFHPPAYTSGGEGDNTWMRWPFQQWGASAVISGHDHDYERLNEGGLTYFVNGLGGESIVGFATVDPGSQVRYAGDYGAMKVVASDTSITYQFITRTGSVIDTYTMNAPGPVLPTAPTNLSASVQSTTSVRLLWNDSSSGTTSSFKIERSSDGVNFTQIGTTAASTTNFLDTGLTEGAGYDYRVRASNSVGDSGYSNAVSATLPSGDLTYVSDLAWVGTPTNGWGPVEKDMSNGSTGAGDGHTITLNGVTYAKGLGAHAVSDITYNLGGAYTFFHSDVGVDDETGAASGVDFQVFADGVKVFDSGGMTQTSVTQSINLNITGVQQLRLHIDDLDGDISYDHADWAGAFLTSPGNPPSAPASLTAFVIGTAQVNLSWADSTGETGYLVELDRRRDIHADRYDRSQPDGVR